MPEDLNSELDQSMPINTGLLNDGPQMGDWVAGIMSGLTYQVLNTLGDWREYVSRSEKQSFRRLDTMACVSYGELNNIETFLNFLMIHGVIDAYRLREWLDPVTGRFNFSDRFTAKTSGTTPSGNSYVRVAEAINTYGLVPEAMWPSGENFTWDQYYKAIPAEVLAKGKEFLAIVCRPGQKFIKYEFLPTPFNGSYYGVPREVRKYHLKHAPLTLSTATCAGWSTQQPVPVCSAGSNHASTDICEVDTKGTVKEYTLIEDHYDPFDKRLAQGYRVYNAFKIIPQLNNSLIIRDHMSEAKIIKREGSSEVGIYLPMTNAAALYAMGRNLGIEIPTVGGEPNTVDWDRLKIDGSAKINT